ncbi:hypothetical protein SDC9_181799 [bioreactor metagenome]|uniref:Uncharacterized protein n=1 Tax=bioreactor metagenome TaxID=1076179 RepID=A0A645H741_9ZZZZ
MRAVGLVDERRHSRAVRRFGYAPEVGADAVIGGVVDEDGLCLGMSGDRRFDVIRAHTERNAEFGMDAGVHIYRRDAAEDQRVDRRLMDVSRNDYRIAAFADAHDHRLYGGGGAADYQKGVVRPEGISGQRLRLFDDGGRVA